ncbi:YdcF family protein [Pelotalea chapellei]|uniref:YdcF family protein n=1 Tax=Pelotalea chapellei TaxID=44671 RepID=A0ABS5U3T3_9BACT|nr:YdcF family protein [Pelotalea chapellei]MBT1070289.1 YdcF family protein [Pelotalea chapellei]
MIRKIPLVLLVLFLLAVLALGLYPDTLRRMLTRHDTPVLSDAIILLAGSMKERVPTAARLYLSGYAPKVFVSDDGVFSSWSAEYNRNLYQVEWAEEELVKLGVPRQAIIKLSYLGSGTIYESMATKEEISRQGLRKIIVVTSDYHTCRAAWTFRHTLQGCLSEVRTFPARSYTVGRAGLFVEVMKVGYYQLRFGLLGLDPKAHTHF